LNNYFNVLIDWLLWSSHDRISQGLMGLGVSGLGHKALALGVVAFGLVNITDTHHVS